MNIILYYAVVPNCYVSALANEPLLEPPQDTSSSIHITVKSCLRQIFALYKWLYNT